MPELKENPCLGDFQRYVDDMKRERGFNIDDKIYECVLFAEEAGELVKAIRKSHKGVIIDKEAVSGSVADELADVLVYLCSIANQHGIDLEKAFRDKEEVNKHREWKRVA